MTDPAFPALIEPLSEKTFHRFRQLIYEKTNINIRESKHILISNRLRKRIVALKLKGYDEYYCYLTEGEERHEEMSHFIAAVSTNETYFYRETNHFRALTETILPRLFSKKGRIQVWSAGCSTGEEAYTLSIVFRQLRDSARDGEAGILATDISPEVIARAKQGVYGERAVRFVPANILGRYFIPLGDGRYRVSEELKQGIEFRAHNLLQEDPPEKHFDIIFCRNVMIYFDKATQKRLVDTYFAEVLDPGGYLLIGHSESLTGTSEKFRYLRELKAPVYQKAKE